MKTVYVLKKAWGVSYSVLNAYQEYILPYSASARCVAEPRAMLPTNCAIAVPANGENAKFVGNHCVPRFYFKQQQKVQVFVKSRAYTLPEKERGYKEVVVFIAIWETERRRISYED